jgi:DNA-binding transcriptional LysR family regulator
LAISPFPPADTTLVRRCLATFSLVLSGAPAYLERHPAPQSAADLTDHNCLRYPYEPRFAEGWHDASGNPVVARISGSLISSSPDTMRAAAVAGIGLVLTAPFMVADSLCLRSAGAAAAQLSNAGV